VSRVQQLQEIEGLAAANLAKNDAVWTMAERRLQPPVRQTLTRSNSAHLLGTDEPSVFVGRAKTNGSQQTELSRRLRPPVKWSYVKLARWFGLALLVLLIVYVHWVMTSTSAVDPVPGELFVALFGVAFFVFVIAFWRRNHFSYPRAYETWDCSFVCLRCGMVSQQQPL
jgi:hypothetical protein